MANNNSPGGILICCEGAGTRLIRGENCPELVLWCDMDPKSSLFFSSIGEDSALLCLNRSLKLRHRTLEPQEKRVPYNKSRSVGENLLCAAADFVRKAAEIKD